MSVTFGQLETPNVVRTLAAGALTQLFRNASFARSGTSGVGGVPLTQYFQKGDLTSIKRIKDYGAAQDYDPRSGVDANSRDAEYVTVPLILDKLFTLGHPVYSSDALVSQYVSDFSQTIGGAARKSFDDYLYIRCFRDWSTFPSVGAVMFDAHPPIKIVQREDVNGKLIQFSDDHLLDAATVLQSADVNDDGMNWYGRVTPNASRGIESSATLVTGFAGAEAIQNPGKAIIVDGIPMGVDYMRRMFMIAKSNAVTGQTAVSNIGDGNPASTVTAAVADTTLFFINDTSVGGVNVPIGAVKLTIGTTANLNPNVAVGSIARLGAVGQTAIGYGVILRVDPAGKFVWMVPYDQSGNVIPAAQIPTNAGFSIPAIGSVNPFYHSEHLLYSTRLLQPPEAGSGAYADYAIDPQQNIVFQVFKGSYNVNQFKSTVRGALLGGAKPSDWRKAVLALAA